MQIGVQKSALVLIDSSCQLTDYMDVVVPDLVSLPGHTWIFQSKRAKGKLLQIRVGKMVKVFNLGSFGMSTKFSEP